MKCNLIIRALINAVGVIAFTVFVWGVVYNIPKISGPMETFWGPVTFLLMFVASAAIVGALVLGKPALLYLDGKRREALGLFLYTLSFIMITVASLLVYLVM